MRVVLVGSATARARVRLQLEEGVEVVAEYPTLASARAGAANVDAVMLAEGLSNKGIGRRLDISDQTVKFHVAAITGKLGAANRTEAVRRAVRRGLITL